MKIVRRSAVLIFVVSLLVGCETDDVPNVREGVEVNLSLSKGVISENGGSSDVVVDLSESTNKDVTVNLVLEGNAIGNGVDYTITNDVIIIPSGSISGTATITAIDDTIEGGNKSILISTGDITNGYVVDNTPLELIIEDDDIEQPFALIFNEVLYDPPSGIDGDANGDGVRDPLDDEFIELINLSSGDLDLSGFTVYDAKALSDGIPRHEFPAGTVISGGKAMLLFGGGVPTGSFGGATVQIASGGELNLTNSGDLITIKNTAGETVLTFDIEPLSNNPDESYTRNPDLTGDFVQHASVNGLLFSPGTRTDGTSF